jgi:hypothetical protein
MKRVLDALCSPYHTWILLLVAWFGTAIILGDAVELVSPNYKVLIFSVVFLYWLGVVIELATRRQNSLC